MPHLIKVYHSYTTKDLEAIYKPSSNFQYCPFFSLWRFFWKMPLMTSESTSVQWSVRRCVLLCTSCGTALGLSSSIAVSAVITLFNFNRPGYTTRSQTFQLCLMKIHTAAHIGLSIPLLGCYFIIFLLSYWEGISALLIYWDAYMFEDNLPSLQGFSSVSSLCMLHFVCLPPIRKSSETFGS